MTTASAEPSRWSRVVAHWRVIGILVAVVLTALIIVAWATPAFSVRTFTVDGGGPSMQRVVRDAVDDQQGRPLAKVDTAEVRAAVLAATPAAADADVRREFPGTLHVSVVPRTPVLALIDKGKDSTKAVDRGGVVFAAKVEDRVPRLTVADELKGAERESAVKDAAVVLAAMPKELDGRITAVSVRTPDNIRLTVNDGREIRWGSTADSRRKASLLMPLLNSVKASVYDVSAPDLPTTKA